MNKFQELIKPEVIKYLGQDLDNYRDYSILSFYKIIQSGHNGLIVNISSNPVQGGNDIHTFYWKKFSLIWQYYGYYYLEGQPLRRLYFPTFDMLFFTLSFRGGGKQPGLFNNVEGGKLDSYRLRFTGTQKSAQKIVKAIMDDHENIVMPRIKELSDIHEFNKYMNDPWDKFLWDGKYHGVNDMFSVKLISSALAGDGNLDKIYNKMMPVLYDKVFGKYGREYEVFQYHLLEKVYERLQNTPPLTDPNLDNYNITEPIIYDGLV